MQQGSNFPDRHAPKNDNEIVADLTPCQYGDEIVIVIRNGIVVKFEQRKIRLDEQI